MMNAKGLKMYGAVSEIREDIVEQAADYRFKKSPAYIMKPLGIAAAVCLAVGGGIGLAAVLSNGSNVPVANPAETAAGGNVPATVAATVNETYAIILDPSTGMQLGWEDMPLYDKFNWFRRGDIEFTSRKYTGSTYGDVPADKVGEKLYDVTLTAYETFSAKEFTMSAEVYAIEGIVSDAAVALKYDGTDEYYVFISRGYFPDTLGGLIDALSLRDTMKLGTIYIEQVYNGENGFYIYDPVTMTDAGTETIWKFLDECRDIRHVDEGAFVGYRQLFSISVDAELIGTANHGIWFTDNGYMITNIMEFGYAFYIGNERIHQLADELGVTEQTPHLSTFVFEDAPQTTCADEYGVESQVSAAYTGVTEQTPHLSLFVFEDAPQTTYDTEEYGIDAEYLGAETTVMYTTSLPQTIPE